MGAALAIALLIISSIVIHEIFHYALAIAFGYKPKLYFSSYLIPTVIYENKHEPVITLVISLAGPLGTAMVGLILPDITLFSLVKLVYFSHLLCLLPITTDGQVILLSILSIIKKRRND